MPVGAAGRVSVRVLPLAELVARPALHPLIQAAGRLFNLRTLAFSENALRKIITTPALRQQLLSGQATDQLLETHGLRLLTMQYGKGKTVSLIVANEEAGQPTTILFNNKVYEGRLPAFAAVPAGAPAPLDRGRPAIASPQTEAVFIENFSLANIIFLVANHLFSGALVTLTGMSIPEKDLTEKVIQPLIAELISRGLEPAEAERRVSEFRQYVFSQQNGQTSTEIILQSQAKLEALHEASLRGRAIIALSTQYDFINQWLLCHPQSALDLSREQRTILIQAAEFAQFERGSYRSDGGKLVLVLEVLMARERQKHPSLPGKERENIAAAYPALRDSIFGLLPTALQKLEEEATLPNGLNDIYKEARARLQSEIASLVAEANKPDSPVVQIRGNVVLVNLPWRRRADDEPAVASRRAIYEFMETYNRSRPANDHLHLAVSYDAEKRLGHHYIIGVSPNSPFAAEFDLTNLWGKLREAELTGRQAQSLPEPARNWGGHRFAGGSPIDPAGTVLSAEDVLVTIGSLPIIETVRSGVAMYRRHSLNLPDYLTPRIPPAALEPLDRGEPVTVELHHGPLSPIMTFLADKRSQLDALTTERTVDGVKQHWYRVKGTNHFIVVNILGETKLEHMRLYLTYAGLSVERIYHHIGPEGYAAEASSLLAATRAKNQGRMPSTVILGPGGTLANLAAERVNAQNDLSALQKTGLRGEALVAQLRTDFERVASERLGELADNLDFATFATKFRGKIPEAQLPKAHAAAVRSAQELLSSFGDQADLRGLASGITEEIFQNSTELSAALSLSPADILLNDKAAAVVEQFREQVETALGKLKLKKGPFPFASKVKPEGLKTRVPNDVYQASLLTIPGREPALLVTIPFGKLTQYVAEALAADDAVGQVMFFGNGGFIRGTHPSQGEIEVGDLFMPINMLDSQGTAAGFTNSAVEFATASGQRLIDLTDGASSQSGDGTLNIVLTNHAGFVVSPLQEHEAFIEGLQGRHADSVELEMGPLVEGLGAARSRLRVSLVGYYSDIPGKEGATLADAELGVNPRILKAKETMVTLMLRNL